jgi:hypothetical protein
MARGRSKKKLDFDIPAPGMADEDDAPATAVEEEAPAEATEEVEQPKPEKPKKPEKEYPPGEEWRRDGKQYDISLQDAKENNKYQSFDETDNLGDAKNIANDTAFEESRVCIVWDRKLGGVCYRIDPNAPLEEEDEDDKKKKGKR